MKIKQSFILKGAKYTCIFDGCIFSTWLVIYSDGKQVEAHVSIPSYKLTKQNVLEEVKKYVPHFPRDKRLPSVLKLGVDYYGSNS